MVAARTAVPAVARCTSADRCHNDRRKNADVGLGRAELPELR